MAADGTSQAEPIVEVGCGVGLPADIEEAGREAARVALAGMRRFPPSAVLVFTSARRDAEALLRGGGAFTPGGRRFLESVPNACIEKPFEPDDLRARVRALIEATTGGR